MTLRAIQVEKSSLDFIQSRFDKFEQRTLPFSQTAK